jgi:hypothetical protein
MNFGSTLRGTCAGSASRRSSPKRRAKVFISSHGATENFIGESVLHRLDCRSWPAVTIQRLFRPGPRAYRPRGKPVFRANHLLPDRRVTPSRPCDSATVAPQRRCDGATERCNTVSAGAADRAIVSLMNRPAASAARRGPRLPPLMELVGMAALLGLPYRREHSVSLSHRRLTLPLPMMVKRTAGCSPSGTPRKVAVSVQAHSSAGGGKGPPLDRPPQLATGRAATNRSHGGSAGMSR